ncbi:MAG: DNA polymerase III subunit gamma/tau [Rhizobacter sp.]|nr:DNA polymerase III subunit gamma/tau [Rhizobacter sp.]
MSYRVLARKYRPLDFEGMVGQEHVVQALANALTQQRLHHAYLFTGTRGVGKTTVSRILAKSLNCTGPNGDGGITARPCGKCDACRDIDDGRFVDYIELDAASNRGVEEITQLLDQAVYKPVLGRFKVYMIDEVHMLSTTAFNAMLKTLEEPPDYLKFVLATTDPQKVPPTVLSRCLQFNLRPMPPQTVQAHLVELLAREQIPAEPGALRLLARAARGSMRDALSLTDQAISFGAGSLAETGVRQMLGAVDSSHAVRIVEALVQGKGSELVAVGDELRALGLSAGGTLEELATLLQQLAVLQVVPDATGDSEIDPATLGRLAGSLAADEMQVLYSIALHGRAELVLAPDDHSGLVMVLLRMLAFRPQGPTVLSARPASATPAAPARSHTATARSSVAPMQRVAAPVVEPATRSRDVNRAAPVSEPPPWVDAPWPEDDVGAAALPGLPVEGEPSGAGVSSAVAHKAAPMPLRLPAVAPGTQVFAPDALGDRWFALVRQLIDGGRIAALVRELAMQAQCLSIDERSRPACLRLRVEREMLRAKSNGDKLQAALGDLLGHEIRLDLVSGVAEDSPALRDMADRARMQAEAEQIIHDDPLVKALLAQFKTARIVPGSVKPH